MTHHAGGRGTRGREGKRGMKTVHWRHSRRGKSYWWALEMRGQLDPLRSYFVLLRIRRRQAAPERDLHKTKKKKTWIMISVANRNLPTPRIVFIQSGIVSSSNIPPSSSSVMLTWTNKSDI